MDRSGVLRYDEFVGCAGDAAQGAAAGDAFGCLAGFRAERGVACNCVYHRNDHKRLRVLRPGLRFPPQDFSICRRRRSDRQQHNLHGFTHMSMDISVDSGAALTSRTITVMNPDSQSATSAAGILKITGPTSIDVGPVIFNMP